MGNFSMNRHPINTIAFQEVSFHHEDEGKSGAERSLFQDMSVTFAPGQVIQIRGATGCGKSALLKLLVGLLTPRQGKILYNDEDVTEMSFEELLPYRLNMGFSFDSGGLLSNKTLFENLMLPLEYHDMGARKDCEKWVWELFERFGLTDSAHFRPSAVAGSRRKAAILARALAFDPELLVLDDPTTGLSQESCDELLSWMKQRRDIGHLKHVFVATNEDEFIRPIDPNVYVIESRGVSLESKAPLRSAS